MHATYPAVSALPWYGMGVSMDMKSKFTWHCVEITQKMQLDIKFHSYETSTALLLAPRFMKFKKKAVFVEIWEKSGTLLVNYRRNWT